MGARLLVVTTTTLLVLAALVAWPVLDANLGDGGTSVPFEDYWPR